jgi:transcriptional regulator with XRE-family HTH domain
MSKKTEVSVGERIRQVRRDQGLTQKAFADSLGIAQGYLSSIECGRQIPSDTLLIALRHLYRVEERWLSSGEGEPYIEALGPREGEPMSSAGRTPLLKRISPDFPQGLQSEDILGHVSFPECSPECYALLAYGDFMAPTIQDNDVVLFKPGGEPGNGDIVLVNSKWGDIFLRRYRVNADGAWLSPDNSAYAPFQPEPHSRIIGVVVDIWRKIKF